MTDTPLPPLPERVAVFADIHGNADALVAVLGDADMRGVEAMIDLGDMFSGPLAARETADILATLEMYHLIGNHDEALLDADNRTLSPSDATADMELGGWHKEWMATMPATLDFGDVFACHGTPTSNVTYWAERAAYGTLLLRDMAEIEAEAGDLPHRVFLCAHSHQPRLTKLSGGRLLVNPGSVGCPAYRDGNHASETGKPHARYALLTRRADGEYEAELIAVPYDASRMIEMAQLRNEPDWVSALETGRVALL